MQTKLVIFCDKVIEAGWLAGIVVVSLFFNIYSQRSFEPDKLLLLRSIAFMTAVVWLIRRLESGAVRDNSRIQTLRGTNLRDWVFGTPLVLPAFLLAGVYLGSTLLSVAPAISLWGSHTRLQGTFTLLSYLALFFSLLGVMRKWEQLDLLWNVLILTSIPVSSYGLLQHFHVDPVPWSGEGGASVSLRVVSTMGNPIFLGAYLIMVLPMTLARVIEGLSIWLHQRQRSISVIVFVFLYSSVIGLQLLCLLFTQSRGPLLGLFGGIYMFIFISLLYLFRREETQVFLTLEDTIKVWAFTILSIPVGVIPAYLFFIMLKRGFRWLWLSWIVHTVIGLLAVLALLYVPLSSLQKTPYLDRFLQLSHAQTGSVRVRMLIWEGTIELLKSDRLRALTGFGPETLETVYPRHYPPELSHHGHRFESVDRSHNETFDILVTTGLFGLGVYIFLTGSIFYFGLKWLGFLKTKREQYLLLSLMTLGLITGVVLPKWIEGTYRLSGAGLPLGMISGTIFYLMVSPFISHTKGEGFIPVKRPWLFIGLFSALIAHLIEIQFGIAVAATRLHFWVFLAVFVLLGLNRIEQPSREEAAERPTLEDFPSRRLNIVLAGSFIMAILLFTLGFEFIHNPNAEQNWLKIIRQSLTTLGVPGEFKSSTGVLALFLVTWAIGGFILLSGSEGPEIKKTEGWISGSGIYIYVTLLVVVISFIIHARNLKSTTDTLNIIAYYATGIGVLTLLVAWSLFLNVPVPDKRCTKIGLWIYPILVSISVYAIFSINIAPLKADIYFKQAKIMEEHKSSDGGIQFYRRAVALAPDQETYPAELGRAMMIKAATASDSKTKSVLFEEAFKSLDRARQVNPLNWKHYSLLGHLFHAWAETDSSPEVRAERLNRSHSYYKQAIQYAPRDVPTYHSWAAVFLTQGDLIGAAEKLNTSLSLDPRFGTTYFNLGAIYYSQGKLEEAEKAYRQAITYEPNLSKAHSALGYLAFKRGNLVEAKEILLESLGMDPGQAAARSILGLIYLKSGQMEEAIGQNLEVLRLLPDDLRSHRNLMLIYRKIGRSEEALIHAQKALELSPEEERPEVQKFIDRLKTKRSTGRPK